MTRNKQFRCNCFLVSILTVFVIRFTDAACKFPTELRSSTMIYENTFTSSPVNGSLTFLNTVLKDETDNVFGFTAVGERYEEFNCILSKNLSLNDHVIVLRSTNEIYRTGTNVRLHLCMKLVIVTENLAYFHLLSDIDNDNFVRPSDRFTLYEDNTLDFAGGTADPCTLSTCRFTGANTDYRILRKPDTSDSLPSDITLCTPCDATCENGSNRNTGTWFTVSVLALTLRILPL